MREYRKRKCRNTQWRILMNYKISENQEINFGEMDNTFFLIGLLNEFMNRFQVVGDGFFEEISWKQCFLLNCISFFEKPPTLKEISDMLGSSHQNVKQMLLKLEKAEFVQFLADEEDKRKQRIILTKKTIAFREKYDKSSQEFMDKLFEHVDRDNLAITIQTLLSMDEQLKKMK